MTDTSLAGLSVIRQAISREDYGRALELWNGLAQELREELAFGRLTSEKMDEVRALVEWSNVVLRGARGHLQSSWNKARGVAAYLPHQTRYTTFRSSF